MLLTNILNEQNISLLPELLKFLHKNNCSIWEAAGHCLGIPTVATKVRVLWD
jgi:hypothetical protein